MGLFRRFFHRYVYVCLSLAQAVSWCEAPLLAGSEEGSPLVIAHRGASGYLPEHTLAAVAYGHAVGADYLEPDVVLTADGHPIVVHDIFLELTTNVSTVFPTRARPDGRWYALDFTLDEIRQLQVHERTYSPAGPRVFVQRFPSLALSLKVPTLREYLAFVQGLNASTGQRRGVYLEIKEPQFHREAGADITAIVLPILAEFGYHKSGDGLFLQCFDPGELRRIRFELGSQLPLVQLVSPVPNPSEPISDLSLAGLMEIASYAEAVGPCITQLYTLSRDGDGAYRLDSEGLVARAHRSGLGVHAYTARADALPLGFSSFDSLLDFLFLREGVDGVFTDFPDRVRRYLDAQERAR